MADRERLVELISHVQYLGGLEERVADHLLANGVIVAPMPMAEWLRQELTDYVYKRCLEEL